MLCLIGMGLSGCGTGHKTAKVSGRVTLEGQPVPDVAINFSPIGGAGDAGPGASGRTDDDGRFTLTLIGIGKDGATVGKNRVTLNEPAPVGAFDDEAPKITFKLPPNARDGTLVFEVPVSGTDAANFEFKRASATAASPRRSLGSPPSE